MESGELTQPDVEAQPSSSTTVRAKPPKRGIIYLSTIPPYMNVTLIREYFGEFGTVGRVYLQLADTGPKNDVKATSKKKKNKVKKKFAEGWVEFERKSVAKKVAQTLNNQQVSTRKKSKQYDIIWSIKYLSNFKWTHLHERLAYEKAAHRQKLRAEIQLAKKKANYFSANLNKNKSTSKKGSNAGTEKKIQESIDVDVEEQNEPKEGSNENRTDFLKSLFL